MNFCSPAYHDQYRDFLLSRGLRVLAYPVVEPIDVIEAAKHLRLDTFGSPPSYYDQDLVQRQIYTARALCEQYLGLTIAPTTYEVAYRVFPVGSIPLPMGPVQSVLSLMYKTDGSPEWESLIEGVDFEIDPFDNSLNRLGSSTWPTVSNIGKNNLRIQYGAGYADPTASPSGSPYLQTLPYPVRSAILLVLGHLYEHREATIASTLNELPIGVKALLDPYRERWII